MFNAHGLLYHATLGVRVIKKKKGHAWARASVAAASECWTGEMERCKARSTRFSRSRRASLRFSLMKMRVSASRMLHAEEALEGTEPASIER